MFTKFLALDHHTAAQFFHPSTLTLLYVNSQSAVFLGVLLAILLLLSFITSGSEVALFTLQTKDVNMLRTKQHDAARRIVTLLEERKAVYTSLLIAGTFFNIAIIILSNFLLTPALQALHPAWLQWLIKIVSIAFILVLIGKILPKVWATQHNLRFAYFAASVVEFLHLLLRRVSLQMVGIADGIAQRSGVHEHQSASMRELDAAIEVNSAESTIEEKNILKGIVKFGNITVRQIMKFRMEVNGLDHTLPFADVVRRVEELHYSRLPVYKTNLDNIVGIINTKDLLAHLNEGGTFDWHLLIRPPYFVPENKYIKDLLKEFQAKRIHFAVVVDEFGGTSGIVTMEDILEEIIGDIRDEFDEEETSVKAVDENTWIVDAKLMLHDMCRAMRLPLDTFDSYKGESDSVGGLVLEIAGAFPEINSSVRAGNYLFTVLEISRNRITSVKVTREEKER
ncbi:gliding motility-associated protein GldE [Flaviaesturariibacter flavus]|uniref:Gliding motility-associated protein GldE n=1 Tax=Flaviaesturariibacter flavus TaxID=2502780 RepID=A0A4V2NVL7_9BACT|nr:gliding motility-associated protein GldE [Flaviaesturariibacter flavus]